MSKALRCDRCKRCFDPYNRTSKTFATFKELYFQDGNAFANDEVVYREDGMMNLCPECTTEFSEWFYEYSGEDFVEAEKPKKPTEEEQTIFDEVWRTMLDVYTDIPEIGQLIKFDELITKLKKNIFRMPTKGETK